MDLTLFKIPSRARVEKRQLVRLVGDAEVEPYFIQDSFESEGLKGTACPFSHVTLSTLKKTNSKKGRQYSNNHLTGQLIFFLFEHSSRQVHSDRVWISDSEFAKYS